MNDYRYVFEYLKTDGERLGLQSFEPDLVPAHELAHLQEIRWAGTGDAAAYDPSAYRVEPK